MAIAEEKLNVKIVFALPGLTTGYGPSHQATEDLAILRGMPNLTIVDAGCGTGLIGVELARHGYRTIDGVDLSPAMVERARQRNVYRDLEDDFDLGVPPPEVAVELHRVLRAAS